MEIEKTKISQNLAGHVIDYLIYNEIDTFFLVTGDSIAPMVDYINQHEKDIKSYHFQHEQAAAMAAESYYKVSKKVCAVLSAGGPGAQNLLNGICGCYYESIPCIFITGQSNTTESLNLVKTNPRQIGFQESPISESFKYFTKYSTKITKPEILLREMNKSIVEMNSGRKGPVLLDLPIDVQTSPNPKFQFQKLTLNTIPKLDPIILNDVRKKLSKAKRPLLLLGGGIKNTDASKLILELVDKAGIPFVVSWGGFDLISHDHPLFVGDIGMYGSRSGNFAIQNCDFLLSIGSRLDTCQTGKNLSKFSRESFKVVVDVDEDELFKDREIKIDIPILTSAHNFLRRFIPILNTKIHPIVNDDWLSYINDLKSSKEYRPVKDNILSSYEFLEELNVNLPEDSIIIPDGGKSLIWTMQSFKPTKNQKLYPNLSNSSKGYSLPAAIGASLFTQNSVICIADKNSFQNNIQELQTLKYYNLPIKIFIINPTTSLDSDTPNFSKIAKAYDIKSLYATKENYKEIINLAIKEKNSILVNIQIDENQDITPKLEFDNPLEDMFPYLTSKQIFDNMIIPCVPRNNNLE